jgi:hypothetical protein
MGQQQKYLIVANIVQFGDFEGVTGGELDRTVTPHFEAGANSPKKIMGTHDYTDIVLTRGFDPDRDGELDNAFRASSEAGLDFYVTCTKTFFNSLKFPQFQQSYLCKMKSVQTPEGTAGDSSIANITVTLAVEQRVT